jgi:hypothetical protein
LADTQIFDLGTDSEQGVKKAVASGQAPLAIWQGSNLKRNLRNLCNLRIFYSLICGLVWDHGSYRVSDDE